MSRKEDVSPYGEYIGGGPALGTTWNWNSPDDHDLPLQQVVVIDQPWWHSQIDEFTFSDHEL
jgi:hypothetical protein